MSVIADVAPSGGEMGAYALVVAIVVGAIVLAIYLVVRRKKK